MMVDFLEGFDKTWGPKYKHAVQSWRTNWDQLTSYFDFPVWEPKILCVNEVM
jgi:transposase-like protein